jgi:hypothetical protein
MFPLPDSGGVFSGGRIVARGTRFADNLENGYICDTYGGGMTTDVLDREDFLDSHRALAVCAREFDRLADDISKRVVDLEDEAKGLKADVRRSPGRCIVQLGPVALTISWLRTRAETVSQGRLLIVEWNGTVGANGAQEYVNGVPTVAVTQTAKVVRESVFLPDANDEKSWTWKREGKTGRKAYRSTDLAKTVVSSINGTLRESATRRPRARSAS